MANRPYLRSIFVNYFEYLLLAFIAINTSLLCGEKRPYLFSFSYAFGVGLIIEGIQFFLPYRSFEFSDILSNGVGCALGLLLKIGR
jgi:VanZ family protein